MCKYLVWPISLQNQVIAQAKEITLFLSKEGVKFRVESNLESEQFSEKKARKNL